MNSIFLLILLLVTHSVSGYEEEEGDTEGDWNWDAGIPHYPHPRYDDNDEVTFFPRIIGGTPAFHGEFPSMISLQTRSGHHICGGSLIDFRHVLTAAHCLTTEFGHIFELSSIRLMANDLSIESRGASAARQIRFPTHLFVHPEYNLDTFANDIAVIRVSVQFYHVPQLFPLPRSISTPPDNEDCVLAGWGVTHPLRTRPHPILLRVNLDVINMSFCNGTESYNGRIPSNSFCAGTLDGSRDACFGDSGGGLICRNQISGVVSFGFGCARRNFPGVYVDVSRYNPWISDCINSNLGHDEIPRPSTLNPNSSSSRNFIAQKFFFAFFAVTVASIIYR